jgi:hypothetical protein
VPPGPLARASALLLPALGAVAAYGAWLGWDQAYDVDPRTGTSSGPYEAWQVVGCVLTLVVVAAVAGARDGLVPALLALPVASTATWSLQAAARDDSGLWPVGALLVLTGTVAGTAAVAGAAEALAGRRRRGGTGAG